MPPKPTKSKGAATRKHENWNARCLDTWLLETFAAIFSVACFIAICAILVAYNGKSRPDLPYGLSLNAIISVLATGCKSSLLFAIGEALSQIKWVWFRRETQPLLDMQTLDSASRGPLGSTIMLFQRKRSLATFGAAIVVLLLAFDPFVQQITKYPTRSAAISDGTGLARTKRLKSFVPGETQAQWNMAYLSGLWSDDNLYHPQCSSGNCTWPVFRSVGMCSKCADITTSVGFKCRKYQRYNESYYNQLNSESQSSNFHVSCHIIPKLGQSTVTNSSFAIAYANQSDNFQNVDFQQNITWLVYTGFNDGSSGDIIQHVDNFTFTGIINPLMVFAYAEIGYNSIYINSSDPFKGLTLDKATECSLALCLSDWKISVDKGTTLLEASNIDYGQLDWKNVTSSHPMRSLCWRPTSSPSTTPFYATYLGNESWEKTSSPVEFAFCDIDAAVPLIDWPIVGSSSRTYSWSNGTRSTSDWTPGRGDPPSQRIANTGLEHVISNIANSLNKLALNAQGEEVNGTAHDIEVFVVVQWPWLILPGLLVLSGISFFTLAVLCNKNANLWKSSIFALLYHGLGDVDTNDCATSSSMEKEAADTNVQLRISRAGNLKLNTDQTAIEGS
ncbi:hypothetical protein N7530_010683 [Penicillium desertorum]|uniref:Uncharacterized protein n=1 Tax=Penicillium desertorum TaxID=1303715 RepID=A0A9W9WHV8_9EURO|nr:hypothetical protein N7530_010683 [Penicillium desertorum]